MGVVAANPNGIRKPTTYFQASVASGGHRLIRHEWRFHD
jgi:hypothetical protein